MRGRGKTPRLDAYYFDRTLRERTPAVQEASRGLQATMGVEQGTRMMGDHSVKLWEMPNAPAEPLHDYLERFGRTMEQLAAGPDAVKAAEAVHRPHEVEEEEQTDNDETNSEVSQGSEDLLWYPNVNGDDEMTDGDEEDFEEIDEMESDDETTEPARERVEFGGYLRALGQGPLYDASIMQSLSNLEHDAKRNRGSSDLLQPQGRSSTIKIPKIVVDSPETTEAPRTRSALEQLPALKDQKFKSNIEEHFASPPPAWGSMPRLTKDRRAPVYWASKLSDNIARLLSQPSTMSLQTNLSSIELKDSSTGKVFVGANVEECSKVKITCLKLPPSAQPAMAPPNWMDWYVIEIGPKTGLDSIYYSSEPKSFNKAPYWLLAFPLQAVTGSKVERARNGVTSLELHPQNSARKTVVRPLMQLVTTLHLGNEGRVPLVHGRNVDVMLANRFVLACAQGKGMIVMKSKDVVPL